MTEPFDIKKALAYTTSPYEVTLSKMDTILYALGIGFSKDPLNKEHLKFTYENADHF